MVQAVSYRKTFAITDRLIILRELSLQKEYNLLTINFTKRDGFNNE